MYTIGVDSGTQSVKALVVDTQGEVIGRGSAPHHLIDGLAAGFMEQDPDAWYDAMVQAVRQAISNAGIDSKKVTGIGVSGQQHGFVPVDAHGKAIRAAKLWCDTSTSKQCETIMNAVGGSHAYRQRIGNDLPVGFTASKILWLKENEPENFVKLDSILLPHDWLNFRLTGAKTMEWGDASGTGLMNVSTREWDRDVCNAIDPKVLDCLPSLQSSDKPAGKLSQQAADDLGLSTDVIVSAGGGDNMMGAIGTGNVSQGILTVSLGTSGTVYGWSEKPVFDDGGLVACFCDSAGSWLPLVCTMNVTVSTELTRQMFSLNLDEFEQLASAIPAGSNGLRLLPWFGGERVPNLPESSAAWLGVNANNMTPPHFARASMEGATASLAWGAKRMGTLFHDAKEIRITGGGSKSALWRQIAADFFGVPVVCLNEPEGAAFGAALQALWMVERANDSQYKLSDLTNRCVSLNESTRVQPNPQSVEVYRSLLEEYDTAISSAELFHRRT